MPRQPPPKTLTLDLAKWICGRTSTDARPLTDPTQIDANTTQLGQGSVQLLNCHAYQCCLGQFAEQCGVPRSQMLHEGMPYSMGDAVQKRVWWMQRLVERPDRHTGDSCLVAFSRAAVDVNDDDRTTVYEKIAALRRLCKQIGIKLLVRNSKKGGSRGSKRTENANT